MTGRPAPSARVVVGIGANLDEPLAQLATAVRALAGVMEVEAVSSVYRTEPVGFRDQPDFLNLVVVGRTALEPGALLARLHEIEAGMGRRRTFRDAPRVIDLDLLDYEGVLARTPALTLPHPRMAERGFVLQPLDEAAPGWRHPETGESARELLSRAGTLERVERVGPLPGWGAPRIAG